ncbi:MAG: Clp protease N-terminal domain-containing protein [Microbacteriaceae bacterium]
MFERFTRAARAAVEDARYEAERRGDRRIGSDHLLLALLQDDEIVKLVGIDAVAAHEAVDQLDRTALAAIGLSIGEFQPPDRAALGRHAQMMTTGAKAVIRQSLANAAAEKARTITSRHLLLALLDRHEPDPAATLLAALPVDRPALRLRLAAIA